MNKNSIAINAALAEKYNNGYGNNYAKCASVESENKDKKMNRSNNLLQKNILTGSRSSFVKSTLKPWRTRSGSQQQFPGMVRHGNTTGKKN